MERQFNLVFVANQIIALHGQFNFLRIAIARLFRGQERGTSIKSLKAGPIILACIENMESWASTSSPLADPILCNVFRVASGRCFSMWFAAEPKNISISA